MRTSPCHGVPVLPTFLGLRITTPRHGAWAKRKFRPKGLASLNKLNEALGISTATTPVSFFHHSEMCFKILWFWSGARRNTIIGTTPSIVWFKISGTTPHKNIPYHPKPKIATNSLEIFFLKNPSVDKCIFSLFVFCLLVGEIWQDFFDVGFRVSMGQNDQKPCFFERKKNLHKLSINKGFTVLSCTKNAQNCIKKNSCHIDGGEGRSVPTRTALWLIGTSAPLSVTISDEPSVLGKQVKVFWQYF